MIEVTVAGAREKAQYWKECVKMIVLLPLMDHINVEPFFVPCCKGCLCLPLATNARLTSVSFFAHAR